MLARKLTPAVAMQMVLNGRRASRRIRFNHGNCNTIRVGVTRRVWSSPTQTRLIDTDRQEEDRQAGIVGPVSTEGIRISLHGYGYLSVKKLVDDMNSELVLG